jgi:hypothetical protein
MQQNHAYWSSKQLGPAIFHCEAIEMSEGLNRRLAI